MPSLGVVSACAVYVSIWEFFSSPSGEVMILIDSRAWERGGASVPDSVARSESNPLRHRAVLLLRLGKLLLGTERLVALFRWAMHRSAFSP